MSNAVAPRHFIRHLAIVLVINTVIAGAMTLSGRGPLAYQFVMSHAIGITTWALIDFGRLAVRRDNESGWPAGWRAFALPALGVVVGNPDYLALMKVRMGDRLTTTLDMPDDLAVIPVPTLLLQPLVENAIKPLLHCGEPVGRHGHHIELRPQRPQLGLQACPSPCSSRRTTNTR